MSSKFTYVIYFVLALVVNLQCKASEVNRQFQVNDVGKDSSKVNFYLLTCSIGDDIHTIYGHSAIRMCDAENGVDYVFNYGTFDFDTPFFVIKFLNGNLDYMLSVSSFNGFFRRYQRDGIRVIQRPLILSSLETEELTAFLINNYKPQNRFYRYDFFFDNCATRIRDAVFCVKGLKASNFNQGSEFTFRECLHSMVGPDLWVGQGIDLLLGYKTDHEASVYEQAMLPVFLEKLLVSQNLVGEPTVLIEGSAESFDVINASEDDVNNQKYKPLAPFFISLLLFLLVLIGSVMEFVKHRWFRWIDVTLFSITALLSLLFWYMWVISDIQATSFNLNVLWASLFSFPLIVIASRGAFKYPKVVLSMTFFNILTIIAYLVIIISGVQSGTYLGVSLSLCLLIRNSKLLLNSLNIKA